MKYLSIFLLTILFGGNTFAQEVSYWVGRSSNPDPMIRHHEAFLEAFMQYMQNGFKHIVGVKIESEVPEDSSPISKSHTLVECQIETVSSVTNEGQETLTIAIGNGVWIKCLCNTEFSESENKTTDHTFLVMEYKGDNTRAVHEYRRINVIDKSTGQTPNIITDFSYNCRYQNANK